MGKRFADCQVWRRQAFKGRTAAQKLAWLYIQGKADQAGFWEADFDLLNFEVEVSVTREEMAEAFDGSFQIYEAATPAGEGLWQIKNFFQAQYPRSSAETGPNVVELGALKVLKKHSLYFSDQVFVFAGVKEAMSASPLTGNSLVLPDTRISRGGDKQASKSIPPLASKPMDIVVEVQKSKIPETLSRSVGLRRPECLPAYVDMAAQARSFALNEPLEASREALQLISVWGDQVGPERLLSGHRLYLKSHKGPRSILNYLQHAPYWFNRLPGPVSCQHHYAKIQEKASVEFPSRRLRWRSCECGFTEAGSVLVSPHDCHWQEKDQAEENSARKFWNVPLAEAVEICLDCGTERPLVRRGQL